MPHLPQIQSQQPEGTTNSTWCSRNTLAEGRSWHNDIQESRLHSCSWLLFKVSWNCTAGKQDCSKRHHPSQVYLRQTRNSRRDDEWQHAIRKPRIHQLWQRLGIKLTTSSLDFPQSNGQSKRAVQTLKRILKKPVCEGRDPYVALLEYRNTPVAGALFSPAQMLMSRMIRAKLPAMSMLNANCSSVKTSTSNTMTEDRSGWRNCSRAVWCVCDTKTFGNLKLLRKEGHPRTYIVTCEGREYGRNRRHLMNTAEKQPETTAPVDVSSNAPQQLTHEDARRQQTPSRVSPTQTKTTPTPQKTSRGRVIRRPVKFAEYVCD